MIIKCYAVFDSKAAAFSAPFFCPNTGVALRSFGDAVNSQGNNLALHPEDFTLYELGSVDDGDGVLRLTSSGRPEVVATASSVVKHGGIDMSRFPVGLDKSVKSGEVVG